MPARTPFSASASTTAAAGRGSRSANSLKKRPVEQLHIRYSLEPLGEPPRPSAWLSRASRVSPVFAEQRQMDRKGERAQPRIGADVAGRLLAPDVLLAGRQGQHPAAPAVGIDGLADEPPRHLADEFVPAGEQAEMGSAEIERVAERLALGGDDVGAHLARRADRAERQDLGHDDDEQRAGVVADSRQLRIVADLAVKIRVLHDDAGGVADRPAPARSSPPPGAGSCIASSKPTKRA